MNPITVERLAAPPGQPDHALDRICRLASTVLGVPIVIITRTEPTRQVVVSSVGLADAESVSMELRLACAPCGEVARTGSTLAVADIRQNPDLAAPAEEQQPQIVAFLGMPLRTQTRSIIGTIAVADLAPREWTQHDLDVLADLAASVVTEFDWRKQLAERRRVEDALRDSEERFRLMIEGSEQVFFYVHDREHRFEYLSPSIEQVLGYPMEQLLGRPYDVTLAGDLGDEQVHVLTERGMTTGRGTSVYTVDARHRDGRPVMLEIVESPVVQDGEVVGMQGFARDISERVAADERLRRQALLFETLHDAVVVTDARGIVTEMNPAAERLYGRPRSEVLGRSALRLYTPTSRAWLSDTAWSELRSRGRWHGETTITRPDRTTSIVDVVAVAHADAFGRPVAFVSISRDVTERKRAEEVMRHTNRSLRALIDALPLAVVTLDADSHVVGWNPAAERVFGWSEAEVLGQAYPLITPAQIEEHRAMLRAALEGHVFSGTEITRQCKDRSLVELAFWSAPLHDTDGRIEHMIGVYVDITEQKRLELQLRQAQKMEAVGRLAGGIAHDFNNLLTAVKGNVELLMMDAHDEELVAGLDEIRNAAIRAAGLTHQLLAFSRKQVLQPKVLDLNKVITDMQSMLRRLIGEDIVLVASLDPDLARIKADPGQIEQVILNLAVNARDAMPRGGTLIFETRPARLPGSTGAHVELSVSDTGEGMDESVQARIFEPFFTTKEQGKGTGLGLSTVYGIVTQSGGDIRVQSATGRGTTFRVYLPQVEEALPRAQSAGDQSVRQHGSGTVLLVEDEQAVRSLAERILARYGYTVLSAPHGDKALEIFHEHELPIDLLLTDVVMPGMSGPDLAARLTALQPELRVIFMSGYAGDALGMHGISETQHTFLEKPFAPDRLIREIRRATQAD
jgi:two-component system, cell cycle sensor histidine kinase and response regulator CckA